MAFVKKSAKRIISHEIINNMLIFNDFLTTKLIIFKYLD